MSKTSRERDYGTKRFMYAAGRIPAYLIADPVEGVFLLLTERTGKFGEPVPLDALELTLDTGEFQTIV